MAKGLFNVQHGDLDEGLANYPDKSIDDVILTNTIQVLHRPLFLIREMARVGKRCIVSFPNFAHWPVRWQLFRHGRMPKTGNLPHEWYETLEHSPDHDHRLPPVLPQSRITHSPGNSAAHIGSGAAQRGAISLPTCAPTRPFLFWKQARRWRQAQLHLVNDFRAFRPFHSRHFHRCRFSLSSLIMLNPFQGRICLMSERVSVRVPATGANLGCLFDCGAIAFSLYLDIRVTPRADGEIVVHYHGVNADRVSRGRG